MKDFLGYKDEYLSTKRGYNLFRFLAPLPCMICKEIDFVDEGPFCSSCYEKFEKLLYALCPMCAGDKRECICINVRGVDRLFFPLWYDKALGTKLVLNIKYLGEKRYVSYFGALIANVIKCERETEDFSCVCFVPRSKENIKSKGFDQSKILAESISYYLEIPLISCLKRTGKSEEQKKLSGEDRRKNVKNKFSIERHTLVDENGVVPKNVLLIDDIVTTGSTVRECAYLLKKWGVKHVYVGAVAVTPNRRRKKGRYRRSKKV